MEVRLRPGDTTAYHFHPAPLIEGRPRATGGTGAGAWSWREASYRHVLHNTGPTPLIVYEIDWR